MPHVNVIHMHKFEDKQVFFDEKINNSNEQDGPRIFNTIDNFFLLFWILSQNITPTVCCSQIVVQQNDIVVKLSDTKMNIEQCLIDQCFSQNRFRKRKISIVFQYGLIFVYITIEKSKTRTSIRIFKINSFFVVNNYNGWVNSMCACVKTRLRVSIVYICTEFISVIFVCKIKCFIEKP